MIFRRTFLLFSCGILLIVPCISQEETLSDETSVTSEGSCNELKSEGEEENRHKIEGLEMNSDTHKEFSEDELELLPERDNITSVDDPGGTQESSETDSNMSKTIESANITLLETPESTNTSIQESEESANSSSSITYMFSCVSREIDIPEPVELVNASRFAQIMITEYNVTNRRLPAPCVGVLFYAKFCPFSSLAAPHFNALSRAFPDIKMVAVDAMKYHSFNTQFGIVGVPTLMIFHNGRPAAKFNDSEYTLEIFSKFLTKYTGMEPQGKLYVTSADFAGPLPSVPTKETDYCLALSWIFILICSIHFFSKSSLCTWIVETVQNTWREAAEEHEHVE